MDTVSNQILLSINSSAENQPDPEKGKNGYRVISEKGRQANTEVDLAKEVVREWLGPEMLALPSPRRSGMFV